jgi:hypothetical protein
MLAYCLVDQQTVVISYKFITGVGVIMGKWITSRFRSKCTGCNQSILKGVPIYWIPGTKFAYCGDCGDMVGSDNAYEMAQESAMLDSFWKR